MGIQRLSSFLGVKSRSPIIVNGELLKLNEKSVIMARKDKDGPIFFTVNHLKQEVPCAGGDILIAKLSEFGQTYRDILPEDLDDTTEIVVDEFTNAVCITSKSYTIVRDITRRSDIVLQPRYQVLVNQFLAFELKNYFIMSQFLMFNRLSRGHITMRAKGYLVAGFYQPLIYDTVAYPSPLRYSRLTSLQRFIEMQVNLFSTSEKNRKVNLSVIATADYTLNILKMPVTPNIKPREFMCALCFCLSYTLDMANRQLGVQTSYNELFTENNATYSYIVSNQQLATWLSQFVNGWLKEIMS